MELGWRCGTQLFSRQRFESSALGGRNGHPRKPLSLEGMTHLQVLDTERL